MAKKLNIIHSKNKINDFSLGELQKQIADSYDSSKINFDDDILPKGAIQQRPLNEKQKIFCQEYIKDFNATESAIRAGYAKSSAHHVGCKILKREEAQTYIAELKKEVKLQAFWTIEQIERRLMELYDDIAMDENPNRNAQIKVLELAMRYKGMFNEQTNNFNQQVNIMFTEVKPSLEYKINDEETFDEYTEE